MAKDAGKLGSRQNNKHEAMKPAAFFQDRKRTILSSQAQSGNVNTLPSRVLEHISENRIGHAAVVVAHANVGSPYFVPVDNLIDAFQ